MADANVGRVLEDLVEMLEDSRAGYSGAADELGQEGYHEIANELRKFSSQRARFSSQLQDMAAARGYRLHQGGSIAGALHRRWLSLREAFSTDKANSVLSAAERGEEQALHEYERALSEALPDEVRAVVSHQAAEVATARERLAALRSPA